MLDEIEDFFLRHKAISVDAANLLIGDVIAHDVISEDGFMYVPRGTVLNERLRARIQRLQNGNLSGSRVFVYRTAEDMAFGQR